MTTECQDRVRQLLLDETTHGGIGPVDERETHISLVFLVGDKAYKMKRAVKLPYVDFSTPALRRQACLKEVDLNRKTAPELYIGIRDITEAPDGHLEFDGAGPVVDTVVEMHRFPDDALFDSIARKGNLTPRLLSSLADEIAAFHANAPVVGESGPANLEGVLDINRAGFATSDVFADDAVAALDQSFREALAKLADRLEERAARGCIRRCHGDLHLRNICLFRDRPRLFDCIEFNDRIATVDRLYDLAFLLMDLWHGGYRAEANFITNRYLDKTGDDEDGFILLPFMMAVRAAVRAHVTATQAMEEPDERERLADLAATYFDLARDLLRDGPAFFIAMGGFSGSGKTSIAEALAAHVGRPPGARIFESDRVRKGLFRVSAETRLGSEAYLPEVSRAVYARLTENARRVAADGGTVIADAVFDRIEGRVRIEAAAVEAGLPFCGVWLDTAPDILRARVRNRKGGPSDATVAVLEDQLKRDIGPLDWRRVDTTRPLAETIRDLVAFCTGRSEA